MFNACYYQNICVYWRSAFSSLVIFPHFAEWMQSPMLPLCVYLKQYLSTCTDFSFIESSSLKICHSSRIRHRKVFQAWPQEAKPPSIGSLNSNPIWLLMIAGSCSIFS
jgi:hypothetical protein